MIARPDPSCLDSRFGIFAFLSLAWLFALSFTGLNVSMLAATTALMLCAVLFSLKSGFYINHKGVSLIMLSILIWFSCSLFWSQAPYRSWLYLLVFSSLPVAYFVSQGMSNHRLYRYLAIIVFTAGALLAVWALLQYHGMVDVRFPFRAHASFLDPNSYAALGYLLLIPSVALCFRLKGVERRLLYAVMVLLIAGITATGSRTGWLAAVGGCLFVLWLCRKEARVKSVVMLLAAAFSLSLLELQWYSGFEVAGRLTEVLGDSAGVNNPSFQVRFMMWKSAWLLVQDGPWWGYGLGTFSLLYGAVRDPLEIFTTGGYVHNDALQLLLEVGIPGLLIVLLLWFVLVARLFSSLRKKNYGDHLEVAIMVAMMLFALHSLINFNFYNISLIMLLGIMLGYLDRGDADQVKSCGPKLFWSTASILTAVFVLLAFDVAGERLQKPIMQAGLVAELDQNACKYADAVSVARPSMPGMYVHKAICSLQHQQGCKAIVQAVSAMDEAISVSPLQPELYALKGQMLLGAKAECIQKPVYQGYLEFQRALSVNPTYLPARLIIANIQAQSGQRNQAKATLQAGLSYGMELNQLNILKQRINKF